MRALKPLAWRNTTSGRRSSGPKPIACTTPGPRLGQRNFELLHPALFAGRRRGSLVLLGSAWPVASAMRAAIRSVESATWPSICIGAPPGRMAAMTLLAAFCAASTAACCAWARPGRGVVLVDEAVGRIDGGAEVAGRVVPDLHLAPVARGETSTTVTSCSTWPRPPSISDQLAWVIWMMRSVSTWLTTATWPDACGRWA